MRFLVCSFAVTHFFVAVISEIPVNFKCFLKGRAADTSGLLTAIPYNGIMVKRFIHSSNGGIYEKEKTENRIPAAYRREQPVYAEARLENGAGGHFFAFDQ